MFESLSASGVVAAALIAPPGPDVLTALAGVEVAALPAPVQVDLLIGLERQSAWLSAQLQPVLAAVGNAAAAAARAFRDATDPLDLPERAAHAEIGAALRLADSTAAGRLETARALTDDLPAVLAVLAAGEISYGHASAIVDATNCLPGEKARQVADRVLARAKHQTVGQLRRCLKRAVLAADHDRPYRPDVPGGGRTDRNNLHPRCGNHHRLKHQAGWIVHANPITSQSTWTSPLGKHYTVQPEDHRSTPEPCPF